MSFLTAEILTLKLIGPGIKKPLKTKKTGLQKEETEKKQRQGDLQRLEGSACEKRSQPVLDITEYTSTLGPRA